MNRDELKKMLPHREPMLLVDEAVKNEDGSATGSYRVTGDEWFLKGHFPGNPVVPGVILCEIMAQTACVLFASDSEKTPYFTGLNKVKFREKVLPHDTLTITCTITTSKPPFHFAKGVGKVNGKTAISGEFSFALLD